MSATQSSGDGPSSRKRPWTVIGSAGAALTVIAAGGLIWWGAQGADHVTTDPLDEHPLAETASGSAWEWDPPEGAEVAAVRPIPSGVAVQLDDGVIALDGVTGEPTWRYRRPETALTTASTTSDTGLIALTFEKEQPEDQRRSDPVMEDLLVLDTATGEIVEEQEIEEARHSRFVNNPTLGPRGATQHLPASGVYQLTNDARIELLASELTARSLTNGTVLWKNDSARTRAGEDDSISDVYLGQTTVSGNTVVSGRLTVDSEDRRSWTYEIVALNADTGEVRWEHAWPIGYGRDYPDPTFTLGPDALALRLYPEEQGRILDLASGEELATDPWPQKGGLLALTDDGYVSVSQSTEDRGVHYYGYHGEHRHHLEPDGVSMTLERSLVLPTTEAFIALGPDPDDPDRGLLTVDDWESGTRRAALPAGWVPSEYESYGPSIEWSAETTPYLRRIPGAIITLDPSTGRVTAFTP